ncbi:MAG: DNA replication and repair protein RecF [Actinobacteria bacterium]|nr:MAG: DNA replication and repair protein RecF [Actinomycetota bacterium]
MGRDGRDRAPPDQPLAAGPAAIRRRELLVPDHADSPSRLIVREITLRNYRSYESLELGLSPGLILAVGENGAGKTNLLEALHVGTQGFSPRSRNDAQLVRFGAEAARIELAGDRAGSRLEIEVTLRPGDAKKARLNGAALRAAEQLRSEVATLVFTPDRLVVVKGGPAARRAYFDRVLGRQFPARAGLPAEYGAAVAQRNAALRRVAIGASSRDAVSPWTERVAELGAALVTARAEAITALSPPFAERADELGLAAAALGYDADQPTAAALEARLDDDLERGTTGLGPHLDDVEIRARDRDLRRFGSQGEQRLAVLSLILAEAALLTERGPTPPLLLLDDVLSELDEGRRAALADRLAGMGQTLITATGASALPAEPAQLVEVTPGAAR